MTKERARELRQHASMPERALWQLLRPLRDEGFHFRRQVELGPYYADIACHRAKVVIEADGDTHAVGRGPEHDVKRDAYMAERGFRVLRFSNAEILGNPEGVFDLISSALRFEGVATPTPDPSPQGGGEREAHRGAKE